MSFAGALERARARAESLMVDSCEVRRGSGVVTDPDTGVVSPSSVVVYSGPCKVQTTPGAAGSRNPTSGEHKYTVQVLEWHGPVTAGPFLIGDVIEVTTSEHDPQLVGNVYRVTGEHHKSWSTAQRIPVEEVQG